MSDLDSLLREARARQDAAPVPPPQAARPARLGPWAILAGLLVVAFLAIHFLWPVPGQVPLPICGPTVTTSCQKVPPQQVPPQKIPAQKAATPSH